MHSPISCGYTHDSVPQAIVAVIIFVITYGIFEMATRDQRSLMSWVLSLLMIVAVGGLVFVAASIAKRQ